MNLDIRIKIPNFFSKTAVLLCVVVLLWTNLNLKKWVEPSQVIRDDIVSYYGYLPATFIYHDLTLKFVDHPPAGYRGIFWPNTLPDGGRVIKMSMGLSIMYLPFFTIGHLVAGITGEIQDGYSPSYCLLLILGSVFYVIVGLILLRKILLNFFDDRITALTIVSVFLGTNLLYYSTTEPLMSHAFAFALNVLILYFVIEWHKNHSWKNIVRLGLTTGLLILVRPSDIVTVLIFFLYGIYSVRTLKEKWNLLISKWMQVALMGVCIFMVFFLQMLYWKWNSGDWLFYSYGKEKFYFGNAHVIDGLFSFRKGWLLYTPIMALALLGLIVARKFIRESFFAITVYTLFNIWIVTSWWCWWYGGGFGNRAFIDSYAFLALPLAAFYNLLSKRKIMSILSTVIIFVLIVHQVFETFQYRFQAIHFDSMTKKAYMRTFLKLRPDDEFFKALRVPDYEQAVQGLPERDEPPK